MQIMYSDEEEREMAEYAKHNEEARNAYIHSADYRSRYVEGLERRLAKLMTLLAWSRRTLRNPEDLNFLELDGIVNEITNAIRY